MSQVTRTIAGHDITLTVGINYLATRPMAFRKRQSFPVSIYAWQTDTLRQFPITVIPGLTYDQANNFINEFNNGSTSFEGRIW